MPTKLTKTVDGYRYEELSDKAKYTANGCVNIEHFWGREIYQSFDAVSILVKKNISAGLTEREICTYLAELKEAGTYEVLTGYCADYDAIEAAIRCTETNVDDEVIFDYARYERALHKCVDDDWNGQCSDESTKETCDANDYWFDCNGNLLKNYEVVV